MEIKRDIVADLLAWKDTYPIIFFCKFTNNNQNKAMSLR